MELKCSCQVLDISPKGWKSVSQFAFSVVLLGAALERCVKYLGCQINMVLKSGCVSLLVQEWV